MKAIVYTEFGPPDVLKLKEIPEPTPKEDEVLVRVHASPVSYGDLSARNFKNISARDFHMPLPLLLFSKLYFGISRPKLSILGSEFAGEIISIGEGVTRFKAGDRVMGYLGQKMGAYAEYICVPEASNLAKMPDNTSFAEAATIPYGAIMASSILRSAPIQPGQKVLVNGASGGIGSAALQLARNYGAEVTGVCGTQRMAYVESLGADTVIDYTVEDFTTGDESYNLIFDVLGKSSFARCKDSLETDGTYLLASFKMKAVFEMLWTRIIGGRKVICTMAGEDPKDLDSVRELVEAGSYRTDIDQVFPMDKATEAHQYAESGSRKGPVVISMSTNPL